MKRSSVGCAFLSVFAVLLASALPASGAWAKGPGKPNDPGKTAVSTATKGSLRVTTVSPSNGTTVSGKVTWTVRVKGATPDRVEFVVDGATTWTESTSPYVYNGDGGTLDTTTLTNAIHTLKATAFTSSEQASSTITASVSNSTAIPSTSPANTVPPTVSRATQVGQTLTSSPGTWTGITPIAYAYQWRRCDSTDASCVAISGATSATYVVARVDAGSTLRIHVTASNSAGSASADSLPTAPMSGSSSEGSGPLGSKLSPRLPESSAGSLYVATTGSDSNPCLLTLPCRTLARGFGLAADGTTIYVRGGSYAGEQVLRDRQFNSRNPVTISAYPGETAVFTGDSSSTYYGYPAIFVFNVNAVRIRGLEVSNGNGDGIKIQNSTSVEIDGLFVHNNGVMGIYVDGITFGATQSYSKDVQIWNSTFTMNGGKFPGNESYASRGDHCIYYGGGPLDGVQHGTVGGVIANNVIYDQATGRGIQLGQSAWDTIVTNNTINRAYQSHWNDDAGSAIVIFNDGSSASPSRGIVIVNNILSNNYAHGVYGSGSASMTSNTVRNNLGYGNGYGDWKPMWGSTQLYTLGTNLPSEDPLFVSSSGHDFHLRAGSAAIGKADPAYAPATDKAGKPRKSTPDLGAFEIDRTTTAKAG